MAAELPRPGWLRSTRSVDDAPALDDVLSCALVCSTGMVR
jgi:hypothetical protein